MNSLLFTNGVVLLPDRATHGASVRLAPGFIVPHVHDRGSITPGKWADLLVLDRTLAVRQVYVARRRVAQHVGGENALWAAPAGPIIRVV
jgi:N-acetylglucosamine-6-phosphate deacetylase